MLANVQTTSLDPVIPNAVFWREESEVFYLTQLQIPHCTRNDNQ